MLRYCARSAIGQNVRVPAALQTRAATTALPGNLWGSTAVVLKTQLPLRAGEKIIPGHLQYEPGDPSKYDKWTDDPNDLPEESELDPNQSWTIVPDFDDYVDKWHALRMLLGAFVVLGGVYYVSTLFRHDLNRVAIARDDARSIPFMDKHAAGKEGIPED